MAKVLIGPTTLAAAEAPHTQLLRQAGLEIVYPARPTLLTEDDLRRELVGVHATIAGTEPYSRRVLEAATDLRVIARAGVGYDSVDVAAATERGVAVTITPGANQESVAEHTMAMILGLAKGLVFQDKSVKTSAWPRQPTLPLRGRTLGIAGLGRIGKEVAIRGSSFYMRLLGFEPYPDADFVKRYKIELVPLAKLFAEADFLTLHVPMGPETKHFINRESLSLMKPTAFLINTARGGLVNEGDLTAALQGRRIAGAALDVFENEPLLESPLFKLDNVLLTAHVAGVDTKSLADMAMQAASAIVALYRGDWPAHQLVNPEVKAKWKW